MKLGLDIFPAGLARNSLNEIELKFDLLLGFQFELMEGDTISISEINSVRSQFKSLFDSGKLKIQFLNTLNNSSQSENLNIDEKSISKIFPTNSWKKILKKSYTNKKVEVDIIFKVREKPPQETKDRIYSINSDQVNIEEADRNSEKVRNYSKAISNNKHKKMKYALYGMLDQSDTITKKQSFAFDELYAELLEHPILARKRFGLWVNASVDLKDVNNYSSVDKVELIIEDPEQKHKNWFNIDLANPVLASLPDYTIKHFKVPINKYYHGHSNFGIIRFNRDPSKNFTFSNKSLVHKSKAEGELDEEQVFRTDIRNDHFKIKNREIDGLYIYHDLRINEEEILENEYYGVIGQNVICKRNDLDSDRNELILSLCKRNVEYDKVPGLKETEEEGWIWINTDYVTEEDDKEVNYSDLVLFSWDGDNLAIPKAASQKTDGINKTKAKKSNHLLDLRTYLNRECKIEVKQTPIYKSNLRYSKNFKYSFLLKYVQANGYTLPLKTRKSNPEIDFHDLHAINNVDTFQNAWVEAPSIIKQDGISSEKMTIEPPTVIGKKIFKKKNSTDSNIENPEYRESDTHLIIKDKGISKRRYVFPSIVSLKEFEFLGYLDSKKLKAGNSLRLFLERNMIYHNLGEKQVIFNNGRVNKIFEENKFDYLADPRSRCLLFTPNNWQSVNLLRASGYSNIIIDSFLDFKISGEFNVFSDKYNRSVKPGRIKLTSQTTSKISINTGREKLDIKLFPGLKGNFRLHFFEEISNLGDIKNNTEVLQLLETNPYTEFKVTHSIKKPENITYSFDQSFLDFNSTNRKDTLVALRANEASKRDYFYYEFNFNHDPSRLQILFEENSDHILQDHSWLDQDAVNNSEYANYFNEYIRDEVRLKEKAKLINQEIGEDLYFEESKDEIPPKDLILNSYKFENDENRKLNEDVFRRIFGIDFLLDINDVRDTLEVGEYVYELGINSKSSIILVYSPDVSQNGDEKASFDLILSTNNDEIENESDYPEEKITNYESIKDNKLFLLKEKITYNHKVRFEYYWGSDLSKTDKSFRYEAGDSQLKLKCIINEVSSSPGPKNQEIIHELFSDNNLFTCIGLPDPALNDERLSLNPKLLDLYCYSKSLGTFSFFPYLYPSRLELNDFSEPYFIYTKDHFKRHHIKNIHFHGLSRYHGLYKDNRSKLSCSSKCENELQLEILHNYPLEPPKVDITPLFLNELSDNDNDSSASSTEMLLLLKIDKFYDSSNFQQLGLLVEEKDQKNKTSEASHAKSCQIGKDATWSGTPFSNTFLQYLYTSSRSPLFFKYYNSTSIKTDILTVSELSKSDSKNSYTTFDIISLKPHFLFSNEAWVALIRFKRDNISDAHSYFAKISLVNHVERVSPYIAPISKPAPAQIFPLYQKRTVSCFNKKEEQKFVISVNQNFQLKGKTGTNKQHSMNFFLICLSKNKSEDLIQFESGNYNFFYPSRKPNGSDKLYHYFDPEDQRFSIDSNTEAKFIYVFEMEAYINTGISRTGASKDSRTDKLYTALKQGKENFFFMRDIRIINIHRFKI